MSTKTLPNLIYQSIDSLNTISKKGIDRCSTNGIIYDPFVGHDRINNDSDFNLKTYHKFKCPNPLNLSSITFEEATELTCQQLIMFAQSRDLPIVVRWSGGIDSTVILSALIKNSDQSLRNRLIVQMNNASFVENPYFFNNVIKKYNIKFSDLWFDWKDAIILDGNPADKIWIHANIIEIELEKPGSYKRCLSQPDFLLNWLARRSDLDYAKWLFEAVVNSSNRAGVQLDTYADFYWWLNFNFFYNGAALASFVNSFNGNPAQWNDYNSNFFVWFNTDEYQQWSMSSIGNNEKFAGSITSYKQPAKDYIFDLDMNSRYRFFKTKSGSDKYTEPSSIISKIYDDGTIVVKKDLQ